MNLKLFFFTVFYFFAHALIYAQVDVINGLNFPEGIAVHNNDLYIVENGAGKISKIDLTLPTLTSIDVVVGLNNPVDIALSGNNLYITESYSKISKIDITVANPTPVDVVTGLTSPVQSLAISGNNLYVSSWSGKISKIDLAALNPTVIDLITGLPNVKGLAVNNNDLYFALTNSGKISKIDITVTNPTPIDVVNTGLSSPSGLVIKGNELYISESSGKISKIDFTTNLPNTAIDVVTGLSRPSGILFIGNELYFSENSAGKISKISLTPNLYTAIPDPEFEHALLDLGIDTEGTHDGQVLTSDISGITTLDISDPLNNTSFTSVTSKITDLTGIEDFVALKNLNCRLNQITNVDLSKNILLETLDIFSNQLAGLDVTQNINLNKIDCQLNKITAIDLSMNTLLVDFNAGSNQLTTIDFTNNKVLKTVNVSMNQLNNVNVLGVNTLDTFNASDNLLTTLDVTTNPNLRAFFINKNSLSNIDLSNNTLLDSFYFSENQFSFIDFSASKNIRVVIGNNNLLISQDLSIFPRLFNLNLSNNSLLSLNIANGNNTGLTNFNISNNTGLTCIVADASTPAAGLSSWVKDNRHTFNTVCANSLTYVPDDNLETYLETHDANGVFVGHGDPTSMGNITSTSGSLVLDNYVFTNRINTVTKLEVPNLMITLMTGIEDFAALEYLDCSTNTIAGMDVSQNLNLEDFRCDVNLLTTLDVTNNTKLFNLSGSRNQIGSIDVSNNLDLRVLNLYENKLTSLNVASNLKLEHLDYGENLLTTSVNTDLNILLQFLRSDKNAVSSLDVTKNLNLTTLIAGDSNIATIDLSKNTKLISLSFLRSPLTMLDLSNNLDLQQLWLDATQLINLDLSLNTNLNQLLAINNPVLASLNIANGNNASFQSLDINNNPALTCIVADASTPAIGLTGWIKDNPHIFSVSCSSTLTCNADTNTTNEDTVLTVAATNGLLANDSGTSLSISDFVVGAITYSIGNVANLTEGDITINSDGSYTYTPALNFNGSVTQITYTLSDGTSTTSCTLDITVTPVNDAPVAIDDVISGTTGNLITSNDTDVDGTVDASTIILIDPNNTSNTGDATTPLVISGVGTFTVDASGNITFAADTSFTGTTTTINYTVNDNDGLTSNSATITFTLSSSCVFTLIPDANFEQALIDEGIDSDGIINGQVCTSDINTVDELDIPFENISDLTGIEGFLALEELVMEGNPLSVMPDLSQNVLLVELNMNECQLTSLDLTKNVNLEKIELFDNALTTLDVSKNILLETLFVGKNNLTAIDLMTNKELDCLSISRNNISNINLTNNLKLVCLSIEQNNFTTLDISFLPLLRNLDADSNQLTQLNIANGNNGNFIALSTRGNTDLSCIQADTNASPTGNILKETYHVFNTDCSSTWAVITNPATTTALLNIMPAIDTNPADGVISIAEAAAFTGVLDLSGSGIIDVEGLQAFTGVTVIDLRNNNITDFSPLTDASISTIQKSTGKTKTVARTGVFNLEELFISNNTAIQSLDISKLTKLTKLEINDNPNLITISVKNGNNASITTFDSSNTPNLTCILVDDPNAAYLTTWTKDDKNTFVADEAQCRAEVLSTDNFDITNKVTLYPNPVTDYLKIELQNQLEIQNIQVYNVIGKLINETKTKEVDFTKITKGIYLLKIMTNKGIATKKVIKN